MARAFAGQEGLAAFSAKRGEALVDGGHLLEEGHQFGVAAIGLEVGDVGGVNHRYRNGLVTLASRGTGQGRAGMQHLLPHLAEHGRQGVLFVAEVRIEGAVRQPGLVRDIGDSGRDEPVPLGSMYGYEPFGGRWGGFLAERVRVPYADAMLVRLDPAVDPAAVASLSDNIPDAWRTVGPPLAEAPGSEVLIVGGAGGSVPLYAIQLALALGAAAVHYLDADPGSLALAAGLGAVVHEGPVPRQLGPFPVTVDSSMSADGLGCALRSTAPDGVCTSTGMYLKDTAVPLFDMYVAGVTFRTGRGHARPAIPRLIELVAAGRFQPQLVTSRVADWESAAEALSDPPRKLVLTRGLP